MKIIGVRISILCRNMLISDWLQEGAPCSSTAGPGVYTFLFRKLYNSSAQGSHISPRRLLIYKRIFRIPSSEYSNNSICYIIRSVTFLFLTSTSVLVTNLPFPTNPSQICSHQQTLSSLTALRFRL